MFNRSEILRSAWASYRTARLGYWAAGDVGSRRVFLCDLFAQMLRRSWEEAKKAAKLVAARAAETLLATQFIEAQRKVRLAIAASLSPEARSARIAGVRDELTMCEYAPWGVRVRERRAELNAELEALEAADVRVALIRSKTVAYVEVAPTTWDVLKDGKRIGQVRKTGYRAYAFGPKGELIREGCKTRAHAALWLVRAEANPVAG